MENKIFCVGYAKKSINPTEPTPLGGYAGPDKRLSKNILDDLYATCIAIKDSKGISGIFFALDICYITDHVSNECRDRIADKTGVPFERIFISCSHTHSAPVAHSEVPAGKRWIDNLKFILTDAAFEAINDATAKTMAFTGKANCDKLNFVRRFKTEEGGWNALAQRIGTPIEYETEADSILRVIKLEREGKKDIILTNFQVHPSGFYDGEKKTDVSAEYIGVCRKLIEEENNLFMFFQGAAGNLCYFSLIKGEVPRRKTCDIYGRDLTDRIKYALSKLHPIEVGDVEFIEKEIILDMNHTKDAKKFDAEKVKKLMDAGENEKARALAVELGFQSMYEARDVYVRSLYPDTAKFKIRAFRIGDIAFACAPCEMFCETGAIIKGSSPFEATFVCELTNGWAPYIPTSYAFPHGGYEVTSCYYEPGAAEIISSNFIKILKELDKEK